ncbi:MAG: YjbQ family protein [Candidatus Lambdaproteobacteria bacterium]|nr:YjbQ family protein [Candidatus Lambdaproteobacteria bacterium]
MRALIRVETHRREELIDITPRVHELVRQSGVRQGIVSLYAQGATAALMVQENWDPNIPLDVVAFLAKLIPRGAWLHDRVDGNGDAHLKAGLVGPSETISLIDGALGLSRWQNVFLCEFDGPRAERTIVCTILEDRWRHGGCRERRS